MRLRAWIVALTVLVGCRAPDSSGVEGEDPAELFSEIQRLSEQIDSLRKCRNRLIEHFNQLPVSVRSTVVRHPSQSAGDAAQPDEGPTDSAAERASAVALELERRRAAKAAWVAEVVRLDAPERKQRALEEMRRVLEGDDATLARAAVDALCSLYSVTFDKASFRPALLPYARKGRVEDRISAFYALSGTGRRPEDLALVLELAREGKGADAATRSSLTHLVFVYSDAVVTGESAEVVLTLLESDDPHTLRSTANSLWGAEVAPELEARLFEILRSGVGELDHQIFYSPLSTLQNKSEAVIDLLEQRIQSIDPEDSDRAIWGLGYGVPEAMHARVADILVRVFENRHTLRIGCLRLLGKYGGRGHLAWLEDAAANAELSESLRERARVAAEQVRARIGG